MGTKDTHDPAYSAVLDGLIARRKALGVTQVELARIMGTDQSQVSKFERRERRLDVLDYLRYCLALGINPADLLEIAGNIIRAG